MLKKDNFDLRFNKEPFIRNVSGYTFERNINGKTYKFGTQKNDIKESTIGKWVISELSTGAYVCGSDKKDNVEQSLSDCLCSQERKDLFVEKVNKGLSKYNKLNETKEKPKLF